MLAHALRSLLAVLALSAASPASAQNAPASSPADLVALWLVTVEGEARTRSFTVRGVAPKGDGSFLLDASYGWSDGRQHPVHAELRPGPDGRRLTLTTAADSAIAATQGPDGRFTGTFTTAKGAAKKVTLEKVTPEQLARREAEAARSAPGYAYEDKDWGVAPTSDIRSSSFHAPTPATVPGGRVVRTLELRGMLERNPAPLLIDVLNNPHQSLPGAHWLSGAGNAPFYGAEDARFRAALAKLTGGDKGRALVFFCLSSECWLSYNAVLRAVAAGYSSVYWYRGGTESWRGASLPTQPAVPYTW